MLNRTLLLSFCILLSSYNCDPQKQDERITSLEAEVTQLKADITELKQRQESTPQHHYELREDGLRTWRFDPATGDTCIQLTSDADWKRKQTKSQSCACTDASQEYLKDVPGETKEQKQAFFDAIVKPACGT